MVIIHKEAKTCIYTGNLNFNIKLVLIFPKFYINLILKNYYFYINFSIKNFQILHICFVRYENYS